MSNPEATVNGGLSTTKPDSLDRVFVGIPDVFTTEQFARTHGLAHVEKMRAFHKDTLPEQLAMASTVADFLLNGTVPPAAEPEADGE